MSESEELKKLVFKRGIIKGQITRFCKFVDNINVNKSELEARIEIIATVFNSYNEIQALIEHLNDTETQDRESVELAYFTAIGKARNICKESLKFTPELKLQAIHVPIFTGEYATWLQFEDAFKSLIDNNAQLSPIQKFHYLINSLKGDALKLISSLAISEPNYKVAWELLQGRYHNKRVIIDHHVNAIFNLPSFKVESFYRIRQLSDETQLHLRALKGLGYNVEHWDILIIHIMLAKLDPHTRNIWESTPIAKEVPTLEELTNFLNGRARILEATTNKGNSPKVTQAHLVTESKTDRCLSCKGAHRLDNCHTFRLLSSAEKWRLVRKSGICGKCLKSNHIKKNCRSKISCSTCKGQHHTYMHVGVEELAQASTVRHEPSNTVAVHATFSQNIQVLLSTAVVGIRIGNKVFKLRAILDSGSQSNFITKRACDILRLSQCNMNAPVSGIHNKVIDIKRATQVSITSLNSNFNEKITCLVLESITQDLPQCTINRSSLRIPEGLQLADPHFDESAPVDMLIGAGVFWQILQLEQISLGPQRPTLQKTLLGWILGGELDCSQNESKVKLSSMLATNDLNLQIEKFWKIEDVPPIDQYDEVCESHFLKNVSRSQSGKFIVSIPWGEDPNIGPSLSTALRRLNHMERVFNRNIDLKNQYIDFMREYERLGHMKRCDPNDGNEVFYLPHHAVFKESKIRVVFDGSSKASTGLSINDRQLKGPTVQRDIFNILINFRLHQHVLVSDIEKMYRGIAVHEDDQDYQRIVWRPSQDVKVTHYKLTTVTYGLRSSAFLATRCLLELGRNFQNDFPLAAKAIEKDFYVDDLLTGHDDMQILKELKEQLIFIFDTAELKLRKWKSNVTELNDETGKSDYLLPVNENESCKILGLNWNNCDDILTYKVNEISNPNICTKRNILSNISKIYDPLGLLSPIVINAKLMMQGLWKDQVGWDEVPSSDIVERWKSFQQDILEANSMRIPRCIKAKNSTRTMLVGFCDASERAYGAAVYMRSSTGTGEHFVHLICSKTKVAPIKELTIPRLELCGALLLTKLMQQVRTALNMEEEEVFLFTDSTIVLCWLRGDPNRWNIFVGNRVKEIHSIGPDYKWNHVSSGDNPADVPSRGTTAQQLLNNVLWWNGPAWLTKDQGSWPQDVVNDNIEPPETRSKVVLISSDPTGDFGIFERYSSFVKLLRITAYIKRFYFNVRNPNSRRFGPLQAFELDEAHNVLIRKAQEESFQEEMQSLGRNNQVSRKSKIISLNPFLQDDVLRVGGRIRKSDLDFSTKHPILLSASHKLSELIVRHYHLINLHCGPRTLLGIVRTRYWITSGLVLIKKVFRKCIVCFRYKPIMGTQLMADLPKERLQGVRPFTSVGCDFAGPIYVKCSNLRNAKQVKSYICLFVCLATKAIHLELVSNLTTETFLGALRRFISRRSMPTKIFCDNAATFKGASAELNFLFDFLSKNGDYITSKLAESRIEWKFITPVSPHVGGIYESQIKQVKTLLKKALMSQVLTYEDTCTVLVQIEAILNSRPLSPMSSDPSDLEALTPGHFLVSQNLQTLPDPGVSKLPASQLSHYNKLRSVFSSFWDRWRANYITGLQARGKWLTMEQNIKEGQLVLVKEDGTPPLYWTLARVIQLLPSSDGAVRSVRIRTSKGIYTRHITSLAPLPNQD